MRSSSDLRFLLLQARGASDPVRQEEQSAFAAQLGVDVAQIDGLDIFREPLEIERAREYSAVLVGGAGEYGVLDDNPRVQALIDFLVTVAEAKHPLFGSCFGFQALVLGLGGTVVQDEPNAEVGTYRLRRTEDAQKDPVFSVLPESFNAQLGHKDRAETMPDNVVVMASSERCRYQALRVKDAPVFATQFHPELTWLDNRKRFERYMDQYGRLFGKAEAQRKLDSHKPSPEANSLLSRFVDQVLLGPDQ